MVLTWPDDPVDKYAIRLDRIENPISLVRTPPDPILFVARDQREGAGHFSQALRRLAERDRAGRVVFLNIGADAFKVVPRPRGQRDLH